MKLGTKLKLLIATVMLAGLAYAGGCTRAAESTGAITVSATAGVPISDAEACRFSVRVTDGGTVNGGTLVAYYYDQVLGWVRSNSALDCTLEANRLIDGGAPSAQVCPDTQVRAQFGRVAVASKNLVDGTGLAITATVRVECYTPNTGY